MPATVDELCAWVRAVLDGAMMPDERPVWEDGTRATDDELEQFVTLALYEARLRNDRRAGARQRSSQAQAMRLLRTLLSGRQRRELDDRREFTVVAASGRHYRLRPRTGMVDEAEQHRTRWFVKRSFCLHPEEHEALPPADVTIAQLLLLLADEEEFLRRANAYDHRDQLWNGEYLRRMAQARRERVGEERRTT